MSVVLGAIADDFTGATDLANTLVKQGVRVTQVIGVPEPGFAVGEADAVVVALKSRSAPVNEAVDTSLAALAWLRAESAEQIVFKYCSTFDSTAEGNIGPVADALLKALGSDFAFVCPAFPENGRTIYNGYLFVGDRLLSESSMKDHPLNPMHDSSLLRLMAAQARRGVGLIPYTAVREGPSAISTAVDRLRDNDVAYGVVDAITDADMWAIGRAADGHALVTGGSAVAMALPENLRGRGRLPLAAPPRLPEVRGRALVLAGSCSEATRRQIVAAAETWPNRKLDVDALAAGAGVGDVVAWAAATPPDVPVLIYSSADPEALAAVQDRLGAGNAGRLIEQAFGKIARKAVDAGFRRLIVAGGETSGSVVSALGVQALRIGPEIDPGVPWTEVIGAPPLALALKSGNFGSDDFFRRAFGMLSEG
ncbi:3-oxo-tetronate kinase [Bauldia sp.]|uniref:3-oxo-tetronate kinase n=1 Tax=Bauldia sp. TaxID=2575872 RepID=UPI003BAC6775